MSGFDSGSPVAMVMLINHSSSSSHLLLLCLCWIDRTDAEPQLLADYLFALIENNAQISSDALSQVGICPPHGEKSSISELRLTDLTGNLRVRRYRRSPARPDRILGDPFQILPLPPASRRWSLFHTEFESDPHRTRVGEQEAKIVGFGGCGDGGWEQDYKVQRWRARSGTWRSDRRRADDGTRCGTGETRSRWGYARERYGRAAKT